jgi:hypothetical protein
MPSRGLLLFPRQKKEQEKKRGGEMREFMGDFTIVFAAAEGGKFFIYFMQYLLGTHRRLHRDVR